MRILCLMASSFNTNMVTTTKRIFPLMMKLQHRAHSVTLRENQALEYATPNQWKYLLYRISFIAQSLQRQTGNYDLIFASKAENIPLAFFLSKKLAIPFVLDIDDLERISAVDIHGFCTSFLIRNAAKVFVASNELYNLYKKAKSDVIYLPNTTDLEYFNPERFRDIKKANEPTFLWVSDNADWQTGCKLIFASLSKLKKGRIIIIGSGPKAYFRKLSKNLGIEQQVVVKDWVPYDKIVELYATCDIGLLPFSDNPWTRCKCPSRIFEFMAMGLPYICTVGEPAYMVKKLHCGLIAKSEKEIFTEKMKYAITHLEELKEGAKQGRQHLLEKQNFNTLSEKLEAELYATFIQ